MTSGNILRQGDSQLPPLDYDSLLKQILKKLQGNNPFRFTQKGDKLRINVHEIARQIATQEPPPMLPLPSVSGVRIATINLSEKSLKEFPERLRKIRSILDDFLRNAGENLRKPVEQSLEELLTDLHKFQGKDSVGLTYEFAGYDNLEKHRLTFNHKIKGTDSILKLHKLTITVRDVTGFEEKLKSSLENYINTEMQPDDDDELEELEDILTEHIKNKKSDFYALREFVDTETLGKLKREAKVKYLDYLLEQLNPNDSGYVYLQDLIRRLRLLEKYISDPNKDDGHYVVSYQGKQVNYRDLFSRAEALDILPIIPLIEGYLGETTDVDKGERRFVFGLKLKLGGTVSSAGSKQISVLDYYLDLLNPNSPEHKKGLEDKYKSDYFKEKVLKILFLYSFIFAHNPNNFNSELEYDPIEFYETQIKACFQESDEAKKKLILAKISDALKNKIDLDKKISILKQLLTRLLRRQGIIEKKTYPVHIGVKKAILEPDIGAILEDGRLFKSVLRERPKEALKYITIRESHIDQNYLCSLQVDLTIEDIRYFATQEKQNFTRGYELKDIKTLPCVFCPYIDPKNQQDKSFKETYQQFEHKPIILLVYDRETVNQEIFNQAESNAAFIYQFTFSLLTYVSLKVILDLLPKQQLFIPILRLHFSNKQNPLPEEVFIRSFSKTLAHLLSEEYLSNSQGIDININLSSSQRYRITNALSSLYSVLPKKFAFTGTSYIPELDKLAIIVVSSRECDGTYKGEEKISNLFGEVITIERVNEQIILKTLNTFSGNYNHQDMYNNPDVIIQQVDKLYRRGFKHFMYIAKSPYSSRLNITQKDEDKLLFFLSKIVVKSLRLNREGIKIYPIFFDKYYVVSFKSVPQSLYIQDTIELTNLVEDPSKKSVVFFNLFNGIKVGKAQDRFYNGVISYATLLNIYEGILDDEDIRQGLIYDKENNGLKIDLLNYLTLFHFARYEKSSKIALKLDPYENMIGDDSVGALSIFNYPIKKVKFNSLAFLTEVRRAINVNNQMKKRE